MFRYGHKYEKTQLFIKKLFITMLFYCLKYRKNTESKNPKVVKKNPGRTMLSLNCVIFGSTKCKFIKEQEAKGLINISKRVNNYDW